MNKLMNFKLSDTEKVELKKRAKEEMLTVSAYIRRCTLLKKEN